jgi:hypothetical protein
VPSTTDSDRQVLTSSELDRTHHINDICTPHDQSRVPVNAPIPDAASMVIASRARVDEFTTQMGMQLSQCSLVESVRKDGSHPGIPLLSLVNQDQRWSKNGYERGRTTIVATMPR